MLIIYGGGVNQSNNTLDSQLFSSVSNPYTFILDGDYNVNSNIVGTKKVVISLLTDDYIKENTSTGFSRSENFYNIDIINLITDIPYNVIKIGYDTSTFFGPSSLNLTGKVSLSVHNTLVPPDTVSIFNENVSIIERNEKIVLVKPKMNNTSTLFDIATPIYIYIYIYTTIFSSLC